MRRFLRHQGGNIALISAMVLGALSIAAAAAVSMSRAHAAATELQNMADGAALSAVLLARQPRVEDAAVVAAANALLRPVTTGKSGIPAAMKVTIESREPAQVTVVTSQTVDVLFGDLVGRTSLEVSRRATAAAGASRPVCLLLLERSRPAWNMGGSSKVSGKDCAAQVNSTAVPSIVRNGAARAELKTTSVAARTHRVSGVTPAPTFAEPVLDDPIAERIRWPSTTGACVAVTADRGARTLQPRSDYCALDFGAGSDVTLAPGVYVLQQGNLSLGANAKVRGRGVTIILMNGTIQASGNATLEITATDSGAWSGIAIAARPQPTLLTSVLGSSSQLRITGLVYLPHQRLQMGGSASFSGGGARGLVANSLAMQGSPDLDRSGGAGGVAVPGAVRLTR